jgi:hypothetical protein
MIPYRWLKIVDMVVLLDSKHILNEKNQSSPGIGRNQIDFDGMVVRFFSYTVGALKKFRMRIE